MDVADPAGPATAKSVKHIRVLMTYVSSPHKTQNFEIPVKIQQTSRRGAAEHPSRGVPPRKMAQARRERHEVERIRETGGRGGPGTSVIEREARPFKDLRKAAPSRCRWPTKAFAEVAMRGDEAALEADPLLPRCPDGHQGQVDVRYWYRRPLNLSCRHCSEGGGGWTQRPWSAATGWRGRPDNPS